MSDLLKKINANPVLKRVVSTNTASEAATIAFMFVTGMIVLAVLYWFGR